jgi:hypothetical protein
MLGTSCRQIPRYPTQDEMSVVRDLSLDGGIGGPSPVEFGANAIGRTTAAEQARQALYSHAIS